MELTLRFPYMYVYIIYIIYDVTKSDKRNLIELKTSNINIHILLKPTGSNDYSTMTFVSV